jgi:hypothetical protein
MANKAHNHGERFERILDALEEHNENASAEELIEDAQAEGRDPAQATAHLKQMLRAALKTHRQRDLIKAKEGYKRKTAEMHQQRIRLPKTPLARRILLAAVFAKSPELEVTFANRDFKSLTDEDVEKHLHKLSMLGALEDFDIPDTDE